MQQLEWVKMKLNSSWNTQLRDEEVQRAATPDEKIRLATGRRQRRHFQDFVVKTHVSGVVVLNAARSSCSGAASLLREFVKDSEAVIQKKLLPCSHSADRQLEPSNSAN